CRALAAEANWPEGIDFSRVVVEPPRDASHGDMATNAAMVLAKEAKAKPRDLAEQIAERLRADALIAKVDVAGPGFINLTLKPVGQALAKEDGDKLLAMSEGAWLPAVRAKAIAMMIDEIKDDLAALNIRHDVFFSERSLLDAGNNKIAETIDFLRAKGDIYQGRLPPPKGAPAEDWEDREQLLFKATAYGDDVDRPLIKSDNSYTY